MNATERRSARLLFASELARGSIAPAALALPEVAQAVRSRAFTHRPVRLMQRLAQKLGWLTYEAHCVAPFMAARRAVLEDDAFGPPRLLLRVDEFPHARAFDLPERYGSDVFARFHSVMKAAGVPYLLAVTPRVAHDYLNPKATGGRPLDDEEIALLRSVRRDGVAFGLHGYDHRTRRRGPKRRSELCGLSRAEVTELLDRAGTELGEHGIRPRVFVPPFNRFDAHQYNGLAERYSVICGGPETVPLLGFHRTPLWRGGAVYMPAYAPLYARAAAVMEGVERLVTQRAALWVPLVLHWGDEADDGWRDVERLADRIAPYATRWSGFLDAVEVSE
jgi:hypothetical protein